MNLQERITSRKRENRSALEGGVAQNTAVRTEQKALQDMAPSMRKDLGVKMTDEQYAQHLQKYTEWDKQLSKYQQQLDQDQAKLDAANAQLNAEKTAKEKEIAAAERKLSDAAHTSLDSLWKKDSASWTNVRIVNKNNGVEAVYKVPKAVANQYAGNGNLFTSWHGNNLNVSVVAKGGGKIIGQQLHDSARTAAQQSKDAWFAKARVNHAKSMNVIRSEYQKLQQAKNDLVQSYQEQLGLLNSAVTNVKSQKDQIGLAKKTYTDQINQQVSDYEAKKAKRKAMLEEMYG